MRRITGGSHRVTRLFCVLDHRDQQRLRTDVQQLLDHHRIIPCRTHHRMTRIRRDGLQLAQYRLYVVGRVFAVDQQPVETGPGQHFCAVAAAQPQPQANLRAFFLQRLFERVG
ncbi:hypothetical protein D3C71_1494390 [compost metagenome]